MEALVLLGPPVAAWLLGPKARDLVTSSLYSLHDCSLVSTMSLTSEGLILADLRFCFRFYLLTTPTSTGLLWPLGEGRGREGGREEKGTFFLFATPCCICRGESWVHDYMLAILRLIAIYSLGNLKALFLIK